MKIRDFIRLGVIVGALPNNIANGQAIDAVPLMADLNWLVSQVNANAAPIAVQSTLTSLQATVAALGTVTFFGPGVAFGGSSTGITYNTNGQLGYYTTIGGFVFMAGVVSVSSNGSATGNLTLTGLPVASGTHSVHASITGYPIYVSMSQVSNPGALGELVPQGFVNMGATTMQILGMANALGSSAYGQTDCHPTWTLGFCGFYPIV